MDDMKHEKIQLAISWYNVVREKEERGELGKDISSEDIFRFMTYWITFNFLFNEYNFKHEKYNYDANLIDCYDSKNAKRMVKEKIERVYSEEISKYNLGSLNYPEKNWSERTKIVLYIDSVIHKLVLTGIIDDARTKEEFIKKPIISMNNHKNDNSQYYHDHFINENDSKELQVMCMVLRIYQVRNNLFHGGKSPEMHRDLKLISECADLLEKILRILLCIN